MAVTDTVCQVETFVLQAAPPDGRAYWGKSSWGSTSNDRSRSLSASFPPQARRGSAYSETIDTCLVRLETQSGIVGWGEAKAPVTARATASIIEDLLAPVILGSDPTNVRVLWEQMYATMHVRGHHSGFLLEAISGLDLALWDLFGKICGLPVHRLLGGAFREVVPVYASGLPALFRGDDPSQLDRLAQLAEGHVQNGFRAMKMAIGNGIEADLRAVSAVRAVIGPEIGLFVDAAGSYAPAQAIRLGRGLEALDVGFFELPIPSENVPGYQAVASALDIPVAIDTLTNRHQVRDLMVVGGVDIVQPDLCRAGGLTESMRMADIADVFGAAVAPHVSIGSGIQFAAALEFALAVPNLLISEYWIGDNPLGDTLLSKPMSTPIDGEIRRADDRPGLGIDVDEGAVRAMAASA